MAALPKPGDYHAASDALDHELTEIRSAGKRLGNWKVGAVDVSALQAESKVVEAQFSKLREMISDAENRYRAKVDSLDESFVEKVRALIALESPAQYAHVAGSGASVNLIGVKLLRDACTDFAAAKGNYAERRALHDAVCMLLDSVTAAMHKPESKHAGREQIAIYEQFARITDPEGKSQFYTEHKAVIMAAHDFLRLTDK